MTRQLSDSVSPVSGPGKRFTWNPMKCRAQTNALRFRHCMFTSMHFVKDCLSQSAGGGEDSDTLGTFFDASKVKILN